MNTIVQNLSRNLLLGLSVLAIASSVLLFQAPNASANITDCNPWRRDTWGKARQCTTHSGLQAIQYQDLAEDNACVRIAVWDKSGQDWLAVLGSNQEVLDNIVAPSSCTNGNPYGPLRTFYMGYDVFQTDIGNFQVYKGSGSTWMTICKAYPAAPTNPSGVATCYGY